MDKNKKLFPQRLWELIHDDKYNFCLRWSPDGQRVYLNRNQFELHYLKTASNQFHTQKAISFVRQMNMYGFKKVDDCYYENDNFKRNCHHLLKNMVRRNSNKPASAGPAGQAPAAAHCGLLAAISAGDQTSLLGAAHGQQEQEQLQPQHQPQHQHQHRPHQSQPAPVQPQQQPAPRQRPKSLAGQSRYLEANLSLLAAATSTSSNSHSDLEASNSCGPERIPLASSLYHRLAALNFAGQPQPALGQPPAPQQAPLGQHQPAGAPTELASPSLAALAALGEFQSARGQLVADDEAEQSGYYYMLLLMTMAQLNYQQVRE